MFSDLLGLGQLQLWRVTNLKLDSKEKSWGLDWISFCKLQDPLVCKTQDPCEGHIRMAPPVSGFQQS